MHIVTYLVWTAIISLEEMFTYSGYTMLPWTVRVTGVAGRTEAHFLSGGKGNYAPWGLLDWVNGTLVGEVDEEGKVVEATLPGEGGSGGNGENGEMEEPPKMGRKGRKKRNA
ncbi:hypothetical protein P152DRAFT_453827 [Eremomyces bilateralis CBS 781.70]|uniref:Uncharacterized protein n=1 Tax=Eremomyces bilateralis CBS 781.70 TaxID=1392243 RepID=A0A6G1GGX4_9PEZI|nr:uncharacterized protein P152DRAFT_453827 [Eremomyces bilateralis CBS 781.70]KAF1817242.1 hypothetical protein P152DRAFT_453827 [Eremomyces bilateralis CBS 781.70]